MNTSKPLKRKTTYNSALEYSPLINGEFRQNEKQLVTMKRISFKEMPFSQHILPLGRNVETRIASATVLKSESWGFQANFGTDSMDHFTNGDKIAQKNPFLMAKQQYLMNSMPKDGRKYEITQDAHAIEDEEQFTTFKIYKKNERIADNVSE